MAAVIGSPAVSLSYSVVHNTAVATLPLCVPLLVDDPGQ